MLSPCNRGLCCSADSAQVLATLLVVGVMDAARGDILGSGNIILKPVELASQVSHVELF